MCNFAHSCFNLTAGVGWQSGTVIAGSINCYFTASDLHLKKCLLSQLMVIIMMQSLGSSDIAHRAEEMIIYGVVTCSVG